MALMVCAIGADLLVVNAALQSLTNRATMRLSPKFLGTDKTETKKWREFFMLKIMPFSLRT